MVRLTPMNRLLDHIRHPSRLLHEVLTTDYPSYICCVDYIIPPVDLVPVVHVSPILTRHHRALRRQWDGNLL